MKTEFIYKRLAEWFEPPCSYTFNGKDGCDYFDHDWCGENCGQEEWLCWKKFFEILESERIADILEELKVTMNER